MKKTVSLLLVLLLAFSLFPASIYAADETHEKVPVLGDTYVQNGAQYQDKNFGSDAMLSFKASESVSVDRRMLLSFDISSLKSENLSNAKINLFKFGNQIPKETTYVRAFVTNAFDENTVTFKDNIKLGKVIGVTGVTGSAKEYIQVDITGYVKEQIQKGTKIIYIAFYDRAMQNIRLDFSSKEGNNAPFLDVKYGGSVDPFPELDDGLGYSGDLFSAESAISYAKELLKKSNTVYSFISASAGNAEFERVSDEECIIRPHEDSYIRGGIYGDSSYGNEKELYIKSTGSNAKEQNQYHRKAFIKFDISNISKKSIGGAFLCLYPVTLEDTDNAEIFLRDVPDSNWSEKTLTWNNAPEAGEFLTSFKAYQKYKNVYVDLTDYINKKASDGTKYITLQLTDDNSRNKIFQFSSRDGLAAPQLIIKKIGSAPGSAEIPVDESDKEDENCKYIEVGVNANKKPFTNYEPMQTRVISSLTDFTPATERPALSQYGGLLSVDAGATGFFHTKEINGRWWMIDPEGHPLFNFGFNTVAKPSSEHEIAGMENHYGTVENWGKETKELFDEMNVHGMTGSETVRNLMDNKMPYFTSISCIGTYGNARGMVTYSGSTVFKDNVMPVFDPYFEKYVDKKAQAAAKYKDDKYLIGYFSDNEISVADNMLENYLKQDPNDENYIYSYYMAWEWLKDRYGEDAKLSDITSKDKDDWREFVFDRYYSLVSRAIKKYDPNHMYLGSRLNGQARTCEGIFRAIGRYADAISFNYYGTWTPRKQDMESWYKWSGKPFIVTECYTKGMDASAKIPGLTNESGAGWIVATQEDRGNFYQNYTLGLIESGTCIGFQWYKYQDNDPDALTTDVSNLNSNKGIFDRDFNEYTALTDKMKELNWNVFALADYFDNKKGNMKQSFEYEYDLSNSTNEKIKCFMVLGIYEKTTNKLVDIAVGNPYTVGVGNSVKVRCKLKNISDYPASDYYVKSFLWDKNSLMSPILQSKDVRN